MLFHWQSIYQDIVKSLRTAPAGGLMVLASGINIASLTSLLLTYFSERSQNVVILLNFSVSELEMIDSHLSLYSIQNKLNNNKQHCFEVIRLNKIVADKRCSLYKEGGIFSLTPQIFMQDLLNVQIAPIIISHLIIQQAHNIRTRFDYESWIANFIKIEKPEMFVLALTNRPIELQCRQNTQSILNYLYINSIFPWPINRAEIVLALQDKGIKWQEYKIKLGTKVKEIQDNLISLIEECIQDINNKQFLFTTDQILQQQEYQIIARLQNMKLQFDLIGYQIFKDIFTIKKLLFNLIYQSPYQFYNSIQKCIQGSEVDSIWYIRNSKVERSISNIQRLTQSRVYEILQTDPYEIKVRGQIKKINQKIHFHLTNQPKLTQLFKLLDIIQQQGEAQRIWIWTNNVDLLQYHLNQYYRVQDKFNLIQQFNYLRMTLKELVLQNHSLDILETTIQEPKKQLLVLKSKIQKEQKQQNSELILLHALAQELEDFYIQLETNRQHLLLNQPHPQRSMTQYQLLPQELTDIDIKKSAEKLDDDGKLKFDEDSILENINLVINCLSTDSQRIQFLEEYKPDQIILLEPNHQFLRELMLHNSTAQICLMYHEDSIEQWIYNKSKLDEENAFEELIQQSILKSVETPKEAIADVDDIALSSRQGRGYAFFQKLNEINSIIVDYREFRSEIPARLYFRGFHVIPQMLTVGDIIVGNNCVIERKCVETGDFYESINNNRLNEQLKKLSQFQYAFLLIEFSDTVQFSMQVLNRYPNNTKTIVKLYDLIQRYRNISILWSKNPEETITIIKQLKSICPSNPEPRNFVSKGQREIVPEQRIDFQQSQLERIVI